MLPVQISQVLEPPIPRDRLTCALLNAIIMASLAFVDTSGPLKRFPTDLFTGFALPQINGVVPRSPPSCMVPLGGAAPGLLLFPSPPANQVCTVNILQQWYAQ